MAYFGKKRKLMDGNECVLWMKIVGLYTSRVVGRETINMGYTKQKTVLKTKRQRRRRKNRQKKHQKERQKEHQRMYSTYPISFVSPWAENGYKYNLFPLHFR